MAVERRQSTYRGADEDFWDFWKIASVPIAMVILAGLVPAFGPVVAKVQYFAASLVFSAIAVIGYRVRASLGAIVLRGAILGVGLAILSAVPAYLAHWTSLEWQPPLSPWLVPGAFVMVLAIYMWGHALRWILDAGAQRSVRASGRDNPDAGAGS